MTDKQKFALNTIISAIPENDRESFREVAEYAVSLGYMPSLKGVRKDYCDFSNNKLKRTIMKVQTNPKFPFLEMKSTRLPIFGDMCKFLHTYRQIQYLNYINYALILL